MKKNNRRKLFDNSEAEILPKNLADEILNASDVNSDLNDSSSSEEEETWVPRASRWAKYSRMITDFLRSPETILPFASSLTRYERSLVHRMAKQHNLDHESFGEGKERFITVRKKNIERKFLFNFNVTSKFYLIYLIEIAVCYPPLVHSSFKCLFCGEMFGSKMEEDFHVMNTCTNTWKQILLMILYVIDKFYNKIVSFLSSFNCCLKT